MPLPVPWGGEVLQVFWCPVDHETSNGPKPILRWAAASGLPMRTNEVSGHQPGNYVPRACAIHPESVLEYPTVHELTQNQLHEIRENLELAAIGEKYFPDHEDYEVAPGEMAYQNMFSAAPGTKIGGYGEWIQAAVSKQCACGADMVLLLTIATDEWDIQTQFRWRPSELPHNRTNAQPSGLTLGDCGSVYVAYSWGSGRYYPLFSSSFRLKYPHVCTECPARQFKNWRDANQLHALLIVRC